MYESKDWEAFRTIDSLGRKAGVPIDRIPALIAKELTDNSLDAADWCRVELIDGNGFCVEDDGDGIPGDDEAVASLFSIARGLTSTKILRRPTRGALGNGLRVVAGAVLASGGSLLVTTRGRKLRLIPGDDGSTGHERVSDADPDITRVEVRLGPPFRVGPKTLRWAGMAIRLSEGGKQYRGESSPHWYDPDSFFQLLQAAGGRYARDVVAELDGCSEPKAGRIAGEFKGRLARELGRDEARKLLASARAVAKPVNPDRLGRVGPSIDGFPSAYVRQTGHFETGAARGDLRAKLPYVIESWAEVAEKPSVEISVNRTPVTSQVDPYYNAKDRHFGVIGCGIRHSVEVGRRPIRLILNVDTPFMPITSDGKSPDLMPLADAVQDVMRKVAARAKRQVQGRPSDASRSQKDLILGCLEKAIAKASDGGSFRFSLRQLFYAVRPTVMESIGKEPDYDYFSRVVTDYEVECGADIPGMYRDSRGTLYHPHTGEEIPLGTLAAEKYGRPAWTFNKILYCEKEGFFPILKDARWPERHDCALMTSKGFASRAARDVLDLLGKTGEALTFYCIHDADASGTLIYQALQDGTRARPGREVEIVNLGLEPGEAQKMGLQCESFARKELAVADYVDEEWREWLQSNRFELNAMTTPQFLAWLDEKFADAAGKVVPPVPVMMDRLRADVRTRIRRRIVRKALRAARVNERVAGAMAGCEELIAGQADRLADRVGRELDERPEDHWSNPIAGQADQLARRVATQTEP